LKISDDLIISREPATHSTPLKPGVEVPLTGVEHVLVDPASLTEDPTIGPITHSDWYRCTFPDCGEAYPNPRSTLSHLVKHSPKRRVVKAETEAAALRAAKETSSVRRSLGVRAGKQARAERHAALTELTPNQILLEMASELDRLALKLRDVAVLFDVPKAKISDVELTKLREKAAQYDIIKSALK
jgi:hypothetical protein